jgi:hypothetical protein
MFLIPCHFARQKKVSRMRIYKYSITHSAIRKITLSRIKTVATFFGQNIYLSGIQNPSKLIYHKVYSTEIVVNSIISGIKRIWW